MGNKIKVLILDDSMVFREVLARGLSVDPSIFVVAKAENPFDAIRKIENFQPDVITCDVQMPKMDGIEFIKQLMPQHPVPIIVVSSLSESVLDALNAGAVDFVTKPDIQSPQSVEAFIFELIQKVKAISKSKIVPKQTVQPSKSVNPVGQFTKKIIAIGASTGGTEAIFHVLKQLPLNIPGVVIVQHIPPQFSKMFASRLNLQTHFEVVEGKKGEYIEPGKVIVAPGDQHLSVIRVGDRYKIDVFHGDRVNGHCPSVDVLFESVAKECGNSAVGVILTGMGYDGAKGLLSMRRKGARTIGQDESTSVVYGMPKAAYEVGAVERQYPLDQISRGICNVLR
ncbi:chemotaxis response regulator protein-glutamate methylesterase [Fusibacter bizertensis]|uniref:Protein-glutamate methylesterase/protein-glutamine glutaminase n=1 Tax=Fusibacter bizertensis TaxID=1488331 RepID=A0ABT6NEJ0_9FIRM|nr:chemotaxis response regulator protein-glutamate methylesterase [Fusibacter bizertensis]MDH8678840.1 chemotaxis response regulator protein-glutamate methylesterase [Fusibacter bizertensis]